MFPPPRRVSCLLLSSGRSHRSSLPSIDLALPTECDDEHWLGLEGESAFKQPLGKPCKVSGFIYSLRLARLLAVAARTIVSEDAPVVHCSTDYMRVVLEKQIEDAASPRLR